MKFGIMFANAGPFMFPENLAHLARTAEEVGVESIWTVEHVVIPVGYQSPYPYSSSGKIPGPENSPIPDPVLPLAFAAAVTKKLRLGTGVMILPQRHPVYVAKEMATLDVLSNGRALLGVGIGWLEEEFDAVGVPFKERAGRTTESIRAIRSLWQPEAKPFAGKYYKWAAVESNPKPVQQPGVPIIVGGHADGAARRAARFGDGFFPARGDRETLTRLFAILRDECAKIGRKPETIELTTGAGPKLDVDAVRRYQDMGITRLTIPPPGFDQDGLSKGLHEFGDRIIAKL
ncbi:MAG: LLM class F420-dependent oxidoreductase [Deltaproteobacteria bacterium]|nr:LLM class F420-dependent oxidoreductase [Deltaproteobacteria bacterium]MBI3390999.1 LLM class F420-dependent oxidoreductase [Deltaproteobacteria bacterium]